MMGIMKYRMEFDKNEGYVISNADIPWGVMPTKINFERSPVRLYYIDGDNSMVSPEVSGCIREPEDSDEVDKTFRKNYIKALQGRSRTWFLVGVKIDNTGASLLFGNRKTHMGEFLHICPKVECTRNFEIEVDHEDGSIERYELSVRKTTCEEPYFVRLTEFYPYGRRELVFSRGINYTEKCPDDRYWNYVYVTEYR